MSRERTTKMALRNATAMVVVRLLALTAAIAAAGLVLGLRMNERASACTGPGPVETLAEAEVVFEGRVLSVAPLPGPTEPGAASHAITFQVSRSHRGTATGATLVALGRIPHLSMCREFPADLAGEYVVTGLRLDGEGNWMASISYTPFVGPEPSGQVYEAAVEIAEIVTGSNPARPLLAIEPTSPLCGQPVRLRGSRFLPGKYVVREAAGGRVVGVPLVGADGSFDLTWVVRSERCRLAVPPERLARFHAFAVGSTGDIIDLALAAAAAGPLLGVQPREPTWAELTLSPRPARCGEALAVSGVGFEPGEQLWLTAASTEFRKLTTVTADGSGAFVASFELPPAPCAPNYPYSIMVRAGQAEFDLPDYLFALAQSDVFVERLAAPPGPPDVGSGLATRAGGRGLDAAVVAGAFLVVAAALGSLAASPGSRRPARPSGRRR